MQNNLFTTNNKIKKTAVQVLELISHEIKAEEDKYILTIAGESGSGKSVLAVEIAKLLEEQNIKTHIFQQDDYFIYPPRTSAKERRENISIVGKNEVLIDKLDKHLKNLKEKRYIIQKPKVQFEENKFTEETIDLTHTKVIIAEGTYTTELQNANKHIFIDLNYCDTEKYRAERNREEQDEFLTKVLKIEHSIIKEQKKNADIIINKSFNAIPSEKLKNIAMLSTHGYFDPVPILGRTDTGGQVVYVLELAKALRKLGHNVDIFTRYFDKTQKQIDPVPNYPDLNVIRIPAGKWEFIPKEFIYEVLPELSENMIEFIKTNKLDYDLYHGHYVDAGIVTLDVAKEFNKPSYFTAHSLGAWKQQRMEGDPEVMEKKFNFKHRKNEEIRIFENVTAHTVTSQLQLEKLIELYDIETENVGDIPPGVDIERFFPTVQQPSRFANGKKYVFCLSRIDTNKGHIELLYSFAKVAKEIDDIQLVIGGGSPNPKQREKDLFAKMHSIVKETNMQERVIFTGYVADEDLAVFYQNSELFVLPSKFEPFGMTTQEAMSCGKSVIASKFGGIRNVIDEGKTGLLVDPTNYDEFSAAMLKLLKNPELKEQIGQNARNLILQKFSWEGIANQFIDFFNKF